MKIEDLSPLGQIFADRREIEAALKDAFKAAIRVHKLSGVPMAISRDGKVALVPAEELEKELEEREKQEQEKKRSTGTTNQKHAS